MSWDVTNHNDYAFVTEGNAIQMSPVALSVLNEFIRDRQSKLDRPFKLLEFGSGASIVFWSQKYPEVELFSVEGNKEWYEQVKGWCSPKVYEFHEATNFYTTDPVVNPDYASCMEKCGPFDLILNDGAMREWVGEHILENHEKFIAPGGMYLRHDYWMLVMGNWVGFNKNLENKIPDYGKFTSEHPEYSLVTINGNGKWSYLAELGGVWRR